MQLHFVTLCSFIAPGPSSSPLVSCCFTFFTLKGGPYHSGRTSQTSGQLSTLDAIHFKDDQEDTKNEAFPWRPCLGVGVLIRGTHAQNSPQDFIAPHDASRAEVGVGPLVWNDTVAAYAQNYANQRIGDCSLVHSCGPYEENLFWGGGREFTGADAVTIVTRS
ncbi:hypothetical protein EJ110_NYTH03013 [Nymphaea thermarum]|nr:hypothetical protein EJ110_NYTH03013 [Nymphaea thermarum]